MFLMWCLPGMLRISIHAELQLIAMVIIKSGFVITWIFVTSILFLNPNQSVSGCSAKKCMKRNSLKNSGSRLPMLYHFILRGAAAVGGTNSR